MKREKGRKYDGRSRPSNETYKNNWNDIFLNNKKEKKDGRQRKSK